MSGSGTAGAGLGVGTVVGNVRLERVLGQGGMGSVWVAHHLALQTEVAVKFILAEVAGQGEAVARFQREATAAAQLRSPHVVQVFDHGVTADGVPYIVMELLDGEDLGKRVERLGPLPLGDVALIVLQICKALGRAHAQGIVHRDIKPDNVFLVDADGDVFVKLLDFGIAKRAQDAALNMTSTGTMVGTPYYMSPEQVMSSKGVDHRSDLWSVAIVAYQALTGVLPFNAETLGALCVAISNGTFESPSRLRPDLPPAVDAWFDKALNRDPAARFDSAKVLADALLLAAGIARGPLPSAGERSSQPFASSAMVAHTPQPFGASGPHTLHGASVTGARTPSSRALIAVVGAGALLAIALAIGVVLLVTSRDDDPAQSPASTPTIATEQPSARNLSPAARPTVAPTSVAATDTPVPQPPRTASAKPAAPPPRRSPAAAPKKRQPSAVPSTSPPPTKPTDPYGF